MLKQFKFSVFPETSVLARPRSAVFNAKHCAARSRERLVESCYLYFSVPFFLFCIYYFRFSCVWYEAVTEDELVKGNMATTASNLWVIDRDGRVFILNLQDNSWQRISSPHLRSRNCFKRVSAVERCAWAINANQEPCLYVYSSELPCRVKVETYENQRWSFLKGWNDNSVRTQHERLNSSSPKGD